MKNHSLNGGASPRSSLANAVVMLVGSLAIAASIVLGFFAFIVIGIVVAIAAAVVGVRLWWFSRSLDKAGRSSPGSRQGNSDGVIEGEYSVVDEGREAE